MKHGRSERGVALIICLFALMLLSGIGLGMMYMADTETSINRNYRDSQQAYFAATAGIQEVRERLMPTSGSLIAGPTTLPNTGAGITTGVVYVLNWGNGVAKAAITPWDMSDTSLYRDSEFCHENFGAVGSPLVANTGANTPCAAVPSGTPTYVDSTMPTVFSANLNANVPYRWVRITLKANRSSVPDPAATPTNSYYVGASPSTDSNTTPICWDGTRELPLPGGHGATCDVDPPLDGIYLKSVYVLTALAITQSGSRRMVQMEVANNPPFVTNAAVDSQDHVSLNGKLGVNGYDFCSCDCTTDKKGVTTCADRPGKACDRTKWAIYSNQPVDAPGPSETIIAGQSPPVAQCDLAHGLSTGCVWPYDVPALIERYKSGAVNVTTDPYNWHCAPNCGTHSGSTFGVPPDFPPNPVDNPGKSGNPPMSHQVTYIPGNVQLTGNAIGNGVLIVDGDLDIHGGLQFYGLILVRGVVSFTGGGADKTNIFGAVLAGQESIDNLDTTLGGSAVINFNRCALLNNTNPQPPALLATHEATY